ncbi:DUF7522 family protein [Halobacterium litoreum]|uniref:Uncharacterized protein n=1 Tax=Halobacterium litoreum TaxID=2039234 RepID=A0ABD5NI39_9EURY|nr:hypothetical protein [Halobacterium litoreum]UHH12199.1 hypothetical protein LT972_08525 [Halobacterium litoreum]
MDETATELADELRGRVGESLRVVGHHEGDAWAVDYMRDDLRDTYETDDIDAIADDLALSAVGNDRQEDLYALGDLRATVRLFDDGIVVHVPTDAQSGYLVSVADDADVLGRDVVSVVRDTVA